jgi:hypothetical protein
VNCASLAIATLILFLSGFVGLGLSAEDSGLKLDEKAIFQRLVVAENECRMSYWVDPKDGAPNWKEVVIAVKKGEPLFHVLTDYTELSELAFLARDVGKQQGVVTDAEVKTLLQREASALDQLSQLVKDREVGGIDANTFKDRLASIRDIVDGGLKVIPVKVNQEMKTLAMRWEFEQGIAHVLRDRKYNQLLGITSEERVELEKIESEVREEFLRESLELFEGLDQQVLEVLTPEQQKKLSLLRGEHPEWFKRRVAHFLDFMLKL